MYWAMSARVVDVHVSDARQQPPEEVRDNQRVFPGEGVIDLTTFFQSLRKIGYEDAVSPEPIGRVTLRKCRPRRERGSASRQRWRPCERPEKGTVECPLFPLLDSPPYEVSNAPACPDPSLDADARIRAGVRNTFQRQGFHRLEDQRIRPPSRSRTAPSSPTARRPRLTTTGRSESRPSAISS